MPATRSPRLLCSAALAAALLPLAAHAAGAQRTVQIPPLYVYAGEEAAPAPAPADTPGLRFRLEEGTGRGPSAQAGGIETAGRSLGATQTAALLARLPALWRDTANADTFAFAGSAVPLPRRRYTVDAPFPPRDTVAPARPAPATVPLQVIRHAPEGEIPVGAGVTIVFNQPVVPLASLSVVDAVEPPARITPAVQGRWRWMDPRTLRFEPAGRLPMATRFTVEVPAGTRAASGGSLAQADRFTFTTAAVAATGAYPAGDHVGRTPVVVLTFDQDVDPAAVLPFIHLRASGRTIAVRLATPAEVRADSAARVLTRRAKAGRWIAVRPAEPLPPDAEVTGSVAPGVPSPEGPVRTDAEQTWSFHTYGPLRFAAVQCGWRGCEPGAAWSLRFGNELDSASWSPSLVRVTPAPQGLEVLRAGNSIVVRGLTMPRTEYRVSVSGALRDVYGQRLGAPVERVVSVGERTAELRSPYGGYVVVDPAGPPTVFVRSRGHQALRVHLRRLSPRDWVAAPEYPWSMDGNGGPAPGEEVWSGLARPEQGADVLSRVPIDLSPALTDGVGLLLVVVEPAEGLANGERPVRGATVEVLPGGGWTGATDSLGLARPGLAPTSNPHVRRVLVARSGADVAVLPDDRWERVAEGWRALAYVWTDRDLYRPGERVHLKGWVRAWEPGPAGGLRMPDAGDRVELVARDRDGTVVRADTLALTDLGGFDQEVAVPAQAPLGRMQLAVALLGARGRREVTATSVDVQEYRRPEFTVALEPPADPMVVGDGGAEVGVRASYYSGGALTGVAVHWTAAARPAAFTPPGRGEWSFGAAARWTWWGYGYDGGGRGRQAQSLSGVTDARGVHAARLVPERAEPAFAHTVQLSATVQDATRQTWSESAEVVVHPAHAYVGLRTARRWVLPGDTVTVEALAVGLDGAVKPGLPLSIRAVRTGWSWERGGRETSDTLPARCDAVSAAEPVRCRFVAPADGWLKVAATVRDERERASLSELSVWVGGGWYAPRSGPGTPEAKDAIVLPDRDTYRPGDTARVLVTLPFHPARGLMTLRRGGIARAEAFTVDDGPTHVFRIPISGADIPDLHVQVDAVGAPSSPSDTVAGTASATGSVELKVTRAERALTIRAVPRDTLLAPHGSTSVALAVTDANGRPVANAEVALAVVDESVLALTGYRLSDPLELFYFPRGTGAADAALRPRVVLAPRRTPAGTGVLRGIVVAVNGDPLPGALVRVDDGAAEGTTDESGEFAFAGLPFGAYTVTASRIGFDPARVRVELRAGTGPFRIVMQASALSLEDVVVTGQTGEVRMRGTSSMALPPPPPPPPPPAAPGGPAIRVRTDFNPLAASVARVRTDAAGRAVVPVTLPDNLTRYRVMVAAVADSTRYGLGESGITAAQALMARPSPPRFLSVGDRFELPVVVQNRGAVARVARVAVRAAGLAFDDAGREVTVPAGGRVQVSFAGRAVNAGPATLQVAVDGGGADADAQQVTLPVLVPASARAFAAYGTVDSGAVVLPLALGPDVVPGFGGLDVTLSSTAMQELTDGIIYLRQYPWNCSEQISSRMLGLVGLRDVLTAFRTPGVPDSAALARSMDGDIAQLAGRQRADGSFSLWDADEQLRWEFLSVHVTHALVRAREKGYQVPDYVLERALGYLERLDRDSMADESPQVRRAVRAYASYVRNRARPGSASAAAARLAREAGPARLPLDVQGWLLSALAGDRRYRGLADSLRVAVESRAAETAGETTFATGYEENDWYLVLPSASRTDGIVLEALIAADPNSDLVVKTARHLLDRRPGGAWRTTHDNGWALLALDGYFRRYEGVAPSFQAGAWVGARYAGGRRFEGRTTEEYLNSVPKRALEADTAGRALTLGRTGQGRMYYRAGLRYAVRSAGLEPVERGFAVTRTYAGVDDSADVRRGPDGAWHVRAGARVRVTLTLTAPAERHHVALSDPLPAGFEAVNPELRGAQPGSETRGESRGWWLWTWYDHQELRDDRAAAFSFRLPAGVYTYAYVARATTPGTFTAAPTHAEEMYAPEVFGSGAADRVVVER